MNIDLSGKWNSDCDVIAVIFSYLVMYGLLRVFLRTMMKDYIDQLRSQGKIPWYWPF